MIPATMNPAAPALISRRAFALRTLGAALAVAGPVSPVWARATGGQKLMLESLRREHFEPLVRRLTAEVRTGLGE